MGVRLSATERSHPATLAPARADAFQARCRDVTPAARGLLRHALRDPWNRNFVLLSDSDVPLYPATLVYQQLVHEEKSRVSACWPYDMVNIKRYSCQFEFEGLSIDKWRKSATWFTMTRDHAQLARPGRYQAPCKACVPPARPEPSLRCCRRRTNCSSTASSGGTARAC